MELSRRDALRLGVFGAGALLLPTARTVRAMIAQRMPADRLPAPFSLPLRVPPVLAPVRSDATTDYYQLVMREQLTEILPGYLTRTWGYDGAVPGPTIDVDRGRAVVVRQVSALPVGHPYVGRRTACSVHLHGSASLPQYDGYAADLVLPGQYKDYRYPNHQDARTLWYHDHAEHQTAQNVYLGLAGMYRIHDELERSLSIPHGRYDVPLIVTDALFDTDGQLLWDDDDQDGVQGDVVLVNGRPWPVMQVERRHYRFRILNASATRSYEWELDSGEPLVVIGTDAGLMPAPQPVRRFRHGAAERYEVVVDFSRYPIGTRVVLRNRHPRNTIAYANTGVAMAFDVTSEATSSVGDGVPEVLNPGHPAMLVPERRATKRRLSLVRSGGQWTINGQTWDDVVRSGYQQVLADPAPGATEVWELRNDSGGWHHPMHVHLVDMRILDRRSDGGRAQPPMPHERGPKDVVYVGENERVRVLMHFTPHEGRYMVHCHNLVHEDHSMMGQFRVGDGGADPIWGAPAAWLPAPPL